MLRGVTLVELLVVVAILSLLVAATIPVMQPALKKMQIREGARLTNVFITGAQTRALERGRPVAIYLERLPAQRNACTQVFLAESPPPYAGDTVDARAIINNNQAALTWAGSITADTAANAGVLVTPGDFIKFDFKGHTYLITDLTQDTNNSSIWYVTFDVNTRPGPANTPPEVPTNEQPTGYDLNEFRGLPYQIFRKPQRASAQPLEMPADVCIDMRASGIGDGTDPNIGQFPDEATPVMITFTPSGSVGHIYTSSGPWLPNASVHLMIGRNNQLFADVAADKSNINDPANLWVSIGHQTGALTTADNKSATDIATARTFAIQKFNKGGS